MMMIMMMMGMRMQKTKDSGNGNGRETIEGDQEATNINTIHINNRNDNNNILLIQQNIIYHILLSYYTVSPLSCCHICHLSLSFSLFLVSSFSYLLSPCFFDVVFLFFFLLITTVHHVLDQFLYWYVLFLIFCECKCV